MPFAQLPNVVEADLLKPHPARFFVILLTVVAILISPGYCLVDQERLMGFSTALSAAIHPVLGTDSSLEIDRLHLAVKVTEPARALINATHQIRNPTDHAVTEAFLLPM